MYNIIKTVLNSGGYDLTAILKKVDTLWVQGKLTDAEYEELNSLARGGAKPENSIDILRKLEELDRRMVAVEYGRFTSPEDDENYPEYEIGKWYYNGEKVTFEGKNYLCIAPEGTVCVWSPKDYPAYWEVT